MKIGAIKKARGRTTGITQFNNQNSNVTI